MPKKEEEKAHRRRVCYMSGGNMEEVQQMSELQRLRAQGVSPKVEIPVLQQRAGLHVPDLQVRI